MKAVLCKAFGPPEDLVIEDIAAPEPGPDEVVVEARAIGLNFFDTLIIQDKYQFKPPLPFSPAAELAGTIKSVGENVTGYAAGDRVTSSTPRGTKRMQYPVARSAIALGRIATDCQWSIAHPACARTAPRPSPSANRVPSRRPPSRANASTPSQNAPESASPCSACELISPPTEGSGRAASGSTSPRAPAAPGEAGRSTGRGETRRW